MPITEQQLLQIMPNAGSRAGVFVPVLNAAMQRWQITTPRRIAAFLAQVGHESNQLRSTREIWGPTPEQARYDLRTDLGNTPQADGDGKLYRGRGLIQITGRANYAAVSIALFGDDRLSADLATARQRMRVTVTASSCQQLSGAGKAAGAGRVDDGTVTADIQPATAADIARLAGDADACAVKLTALQGGHERLRREIELLGRARRGGYKYELRTK